ncbi:hypothetical protein G3480_01815 [Thiorhodococcus mannitoliphagus]|uniref:Transmembrane protein (PGPGW) n=1 Tax=Thiorhodococcus mannitoliphagus TaxID=329406 RepID=A0A6P1DMB5_9GAMM|nr:PGPGW domain-containing protein [Thiorhodococcus mannitoliphagus]NEX19059.1 hypothetical protein [Thiorhodococcus mannitoliphagus]
MIDAILTWAEHYEHILLWLGVLSLLLCILSILALPFLAALIPEDYFAEPTRHRTPLRRYHPLVYMTIKVIKNIIGWLLIIAGILMLVLPGQGLLTILMGLVLSDFPGKFALERRIAGSAKIMSGINWLRGRAGRPPLQAPAATAD